MFDLFATPLLLLAFPLEQPHLLTFNDALRLIILVPLALWLLPNYGVMGIIAAKFVAQLVAVCVTLVLLWHKRPHSPDFT
jgi:hypothetical protein